MDFCLRSAANGHEVYWFRRSSKPIRDGEGFPDITIVDRWQDYMQTCRDGLIIATSNNVYLRELDDYRRFGFTNICAPTLASARLEVDRLAGMKLFEQKGLDLPPYKMFKTLQDAKKHVLKTDCNYAFKPTGDEENKALTFVSSNPAQLCQWLDHQIEKGMVLKGECMLQEKVEFIAEIGIAAYMGPQGFLEGKWELSAEFKKLCSGNFGPSTGEQGTTIMYVESDPLVDILKSFEDVLIGLGHRGDVAINGGIDEKGRYLPFEWTCRQGWPDAWIRTAANKGDQAEWMRAMLQGRDTLKVSRDVHIGVVMSQRPYPWGDGSDDEVLGNAIYGLEAVWSDVHPCHMMMGKGYDCVGDTVVTGNIYKTTGPYVLVATGSGSTVSKAMRNVYDTIAQIKLSDAIVRDDIGDDLEHELPKLHKLGYCRDMEWD